MRLVSFEAGGAPSFGLWTDDGVIDLAQRTPLCRPARAGGGRRPGRDRLCGGAAPGHAHADVRLDRPLLAWGKCFCVGVNYPDRNREYKDSSAAPEYPSLFVRFPENLVGPGMPLLRPPESVQLDYEGEVALVIGKRGRRIPRARWA